MKKVLMNASMASMIYQFNIENMEILKSLGAEVDVACNFGNENPISEEEIQKLIDYLNGNQIKYYRTSCPRSPLSFFRIVKTYKQLKTIANTEHYDLVHTQSPVGGVLCRLAFRKARHSGTKILYQAHGFHFYKGAPFKNWLLFYPIEKLCSKITDFLILINQEDYELACKKMKAKNILYLPGVGVDLEKFSNVKTNINQIRNEIGIPPDKKWLLSVGELIERKNHSEMIKAIADIDDVFYTIAGRGPLEKDLKRLITELGVEDRVKLLGFRTDIPDLLSATDIFVFPSLQEGLPVALMEAMANGLPVSCSHIRGNIDLIDNNKGGTLFDPQNQQSIKNAVLKILRNDLESMGQYNRKKVNQFSKTKINKKMESIYSRCLHI